MRTVTITLTDDADGAVSCKVDFGGALDDNSPAHQHAGMMLSMMDGLYAARGQTGEVEEQPELVAAGG